MALNSTWNSRWAALLAERILTIFFGGKIWKILFFYYLKLFRNQCETCVLDFRSLEILVWQSDKKFTFRYKNRFHNDGLRLWTNGSDQSCTTLEKRENRILADRLTLGVDTAIFGIQITRLAWPILVFPLISRARQERISNKIRLEHFDEI